MQKKSKIEASPAQQQTTPDESYWYDSTPPDLEPSPSDESHEFAFNDSTSRTPSPFDESHEFASDGSTSQMPSPHDESDELASDISTAQTEDRLELELDLVLASSPSGSLWGKGSIPSPVQGEAKNSVSHIQQRRSLRRPILKRQAPERKLDTRLASAMALRVKRRLQRQLRIRSNPNTPRFRLQQRSSAMDAVMADEPKATGFHEHRKSISMDSVMEDESMFSSLRSRAKAPALGSQSLHTSPARLLVKRIGREKYSPSGSPLSSTEGSASGSKLQLSRSCHGVQWSKSGSEDSVGSSTPRRPSRSGVQFSRSRSYHGVQWSKSQRDGSAGRPVTRRPSRSRAQLSQTCHREQRSKSGADDSAGRPVTRGPRTHRRMSVSDERVLLRMHSSSP